MRADNCVHFAVKRFVNLRFRLILINICSNPGLMSGCMLGRTERRALKDSRRLNDAPEVIRVSMACLKE